MKRNRNRKYTFIWFLLQTLCSEIENQDIEAFTEAVKQFDSISRLDTWYTTLLLRQGGTFLLFSLYWWTGVMLRLYTRNACA